VGSSGFPDHPGIVPHRCDRRLRPLLLAVLLLAASGCTGVEIGGEFTEIVNERCVLLDGNPIELPGGIAAREDDGTIVEDPFVGRDTVIARIGDEMTGGASSRERTAGACGDGYDTYLQATSVEVDVPDATPAASPSE
jgi:hypothetical protein